jgi:hypothetical protein
MVHALGCADTLELGELSVGHRRAQACA